VGAYDPASIRRLKRERDGIIYVAGSGQLVRALLAEGLVDDLHLFVYPVALGEGEKFWSEGNGPTRLALKSQGAYDNGVVHQAYGPA
jgi:dihydrofolate reductase